LASGSHDDRRTGNGRYPTTLRGPTGRELARLDIAQTAIASRYDTCLRTELEFGFLSWGGARFGGVFRFRSQDSVSGAAAVAAWGVVRAGANQAVQRALNEQQVFHMQQVLGPSWRYNAGLLTRLSA
jgi:hypothetical protein